MKKHNNRSTKLSVIIPSYNEEKNFKRGVLEKVNGYLTRQKYKWEVILVNDGSLDDTLKLFQKFVKNHPGFRILDIPHGGKVAAVSAGVKEAWGEIILFSDFDQSTPINEVEKVLVAFGNGADIVIGERSSKDVNRSFFQTVRSKAFNLAVQAIALPGIKDTQCGFKAFKSEIGKKLFNELKVTHHTQKGGYMGAFDVEILFLARRYGFKISAVPVSWQYFKSGRLSSLEPIKMLRDVCLVSLISLLRKYPASNLNMDKGFRYHFIAIFILLVLTIPTVVGAIQPGYFRMHDDLQAMRQLVMDKCFKDLQIPCRWSQDLGYGYGYPLFNFYPPLPYYFGQLVHWVGFSFTDTFKVLVVLNFIATGLAMYLLAQEFWGRWGGLVSGLFYVYAPYHAVDIYVRAAVNEAWALAWFPLIFWSLYKLIVLQKWKYVSVLSVAVAFLMLSHNPMLMIFTPFALIWAAYWLMQSRNFWVLKKLFVSGLWAVGLSAFFTLPVIFEQKYAHVETLVIGYFNYLAHFANVNQLFFSRNWGYGDSRFGPVDDISFQIGHLHWGLSVLVLFAALVYFKKNLKVSFMVPLVFAATLFYTFLSHEKSSFIWSVIQPLQYLQFPWRFLTISIFGFSFLAGGSIFFLNYRLSSKVRAILAAVVILFLIFLNKDYFRFKDYWPWVTDEVKFSGELWRLQITSGIFDYLPKWAPLPPAKPPDGNIEILGEGTAKTIFKNSTGQEYLVKMAEDGVVRISTFYFPGWRYFVNGKEVVTNPSEDKELGRPMIKLLQGEHNITAKFTNTLVRVVGNSLSLVSWGILISLLLYRPIKKLLT